MPDIESNVGAVTAPEPESIVKFVVEALEEKVFVPEPTNMTLLKVAAPVDLAIVWGDVPSK